MNIVEFKGRKVILWTMPDGDKQPFYLSSGRNSNMPDTWLPFDGYSDRSGIGWFIKDRFCNNTEANLHRFGEKKYQKASEDIAEFFKTSEEVHNERQVENGILVNLFLMEEGWVEINQGKSK